MKKYISVVSIAFFVILTIPAEISCKTITHCIALGDKCVSHVDCCSLFCYQTSNIHQQYCMSIPSQNRTDVELTTKIQHGMCSYNASFNSESSNMLFEMYGVNAAHALLPPDTFVQVYVGETSIKVQINNLTVDNNATILEVSREAAYKLGIKHEGLFPCSVGVWATEPDYSELHNLIGVVGSFFTVVLIAMRFL